MAVGWNSKHNNKLTTTPSRSNIDWIIGQMYFQIVLGSIPPKVAKRAMSFAGYNRITQAPTNNAEIGAMGEGNPASPSSPMPPLRPLQIHQNIHTSSDLRTNLGAICQAFGSSNPSPSAPHDRHLVQKSIMGAAAKLLTKDMRIKRDA